MVFVLILFIYLFIFFFSSSVQNVDSLVVVLGGLQEDQDLKRVVEEMSRLKLEEDGYPYVSAPEIVNDLQQATDSVLSRDELDKVGGLFCSVLYYFICSFFSFYSILFPLALELYMVVLSCHQQ